MAKTLPIIINPNPILRKKSLPVKAEELFNANFRHLLADMNQTLIEKDGAGLAAPQIGKNIRLLLIRHEDQDYIMINPQISRKSWAKEIDNEGCLSVVNEAGEILYGPVGRHKKINCIYFDINNKKQKLAASGLLARIIQHEIDHLDGILFIDYVEDQTQLKTLDEE